MTTKTSLAELLDEQLELTLRELCQDCQVHADLVIELVEYGIVEPHGQSPREWRFHGYDLIRIKKALRLHRDLHINLPGIALSLDLLEEREALRRQLGIRAAD